MGWLSTKCNGDDRFAAVSQVRIYVLVCACAVVLFTVTNINCDML